MGTHKDLDVWKNGIQLVIDVYQLTDSYPQSEQFGLTSQMRRAAVSIPSNIAEGAGRQSNKEYVHFLYVALGSIAELETQIILSQNLKFTDDKNINNKIELVRKQLYSLVKYLKGTK